MLLLLYPNNFDNIFKKRLKNVFDQSCQDQFDH